MVEYNEKPIIRHIVDTLKECGIDDIAIVNGYKKLVLEKYLQDDNIQMFTNEKYASTNMVSTMFCATEFFDDDLIVSYADIVYNRTILKALLDSKADFSVVVDKEWEKLWSLRMDDPLSDAETLKIENGRIVELGKKASSLSEIQGQYIGLFKISKNSINKVMDYYLSLDKTAIYDGQDYDNIYMTSLIQLIIDNVMRVEPVCINSGWVEIDSISDLEAYGSAKLI